jgi:hypothetical protein
MGNTNSASSPPYDWGEPVVEWFIKFFDNIVIIASLGAGFSFSIIISDPALPPANKRWCLTSDDVRFYLAVSWTLFVLAIGGAVAGSQLFQFYKPPLITKLNDSTKTMPIVVSLVSITLQLLVIVAFMLDERVIAAYVDAVGWSTFAITGGFGLTAIVSWLWKL